MAHNYKVHPSIGVARVGNHPSAFFLAPDAIGGLPIECDPETGDETGADFANFKEEGLIRRQGQKFRLYDGDTELDLEALKAAGTITSYKWTVHLANQKSSWYEYSELKGNLLLGEENSYQTWFDQNEIGIRNNIADTTIGDEYRRKFLIDPGPITVSEPDSDFIAIDDNFNSGNGYPVNFPHKGDTVEPPEDQYPDFDPNGYGTDITKLGDIKTDTKGNLIVLGGYGNSWGHTPLTGYGGGNTWYDDISDGYVTCEITFTDAPSQPEVFKAWVIVGPSDFAPEIVNISSWDDTSFDAAVRGGHVTSELHDGTNFNTGFYPDYDRDIKPIINRISSYHWVANVQAMLGFSADRPGFSTPTPTAEELALRAKYFAYFREPEPPTPGSVDANRQTQLFSGVEDGPEKYTGIPMMPLNSGSNSVSNISIEKFLALTPTQYFCLQQWSEGKLSQSGGANWVDIYADVDPRDRASIGNVVGLPQCPGIEVTWTTQNTAIYDYANGLHQIKFEPVDLSAGIDIGVDECAAQTCQPGDLTKRMAIPWQADYYNCSIQLVNYTDPAVNKYDPDGTGNIPLPPTYYAYWWPPQAPWDVISEQLTKTEQENSNNSEMAGLQVSYARGMNGYSQMVNGGWAALGFIRNKNTDANYGQDFPYFVETERNHDMFTYNEIAYTDVPNANPNDEEGAFVITSFNPDGPPAAMQSLAARMDRSARRHRRHLGLEKAIAAAANLTKIPVTRQRNEVPRSGRRIRF